MQLKLLSTISANGFRPNPWQPASGVGSISQRCCILTNQTYLWSFSFFSNTFTYVEACFATLFDGNLKLEVENYMVCFLKLPEPSQSANALRGARECVLISWAFSCTTNQDFQTRFANQKMVPCFKIVSCIVISVQKMMTLLRLNALTVK